MMVPSHPTPIVDHGKPDSEVDRVSLGRYPDPVRKSGDSPYPPMNRSTTRRRFLQSSVAFAASSGILLGEEKRHASSLE